MTGFADAESSFSVLIQKNFNYKTTWRIKIFFGIGLHKKDLALLEAIKSTLGVGQIHKHGKDSFQFRVDSIKELQVIVDHFNVYPLKSAKLADFLLFKDCFSIIKSKEHLTEEGLVKLVNLKASLNLGLSDELKEFFPNVVADKVKTTFLIGDLDPYWVAGFTSGDGSFHVKTSSSTTKLGTRIQLRFSIGLNIREKELIIALTKFFNLNDFNKYVYISSNSVHFQTTIFSDITNIIIPFFLKNTQYKGLRN